MKYCHAWISTIQTRVCFEIKREIRDSSTSIIRLYLVLEADITWQQIWYLHASHPNVSSNVRTWFTTAAWICLLTITFSRVLSNGQTVEDNIGIALVNVAIMLVIFRGDPVDNSKSWHDIFVLENIECGLSTIYGTREMPFFSWLTSSARTHIWMAIWPTVG